MKNFRLFVITSLAVLLPAAFALTHRENAAGSGESVGNGICKVSGKSEHKGNGALLGQNTIRESSSLNIHKGRPADMRSAPRTVIQAVGDYPEIRGCLLFFDGMESVYDIGLYPVPTSDGGERNQLFTTLMANYGGCEVDGVYYLGNYEKFLGYISIFTVCGYDVETGEQVLKYDADITCMAPAGMSRDPVTGKAIGIFFNGEDGLDLAVMDYSGQTPQRQVLGHLTGDFDAKGFHSFAVRGDGSCYAIDRAGDLFSIDRASAVAVKIGATGYVPHYVSGACIDEKTGRMFWTVNPEDNTGFLTEVNLETGAASFVCSFPANDEYAGIYVPRPLAEPTAPGAVENLEVTPVDGSLQCKVSFKTPYWCYDGTTPGNGSLESFIYIDDVLQLRQPVSWDTRETVVCTAPEAGVHTFAVVLGNESGPGPKSKVKDVWVGADTPLAPAPVLTYGNGVMNLEWEAVTQSLHGGWIDKDHLGYRITRSDGSVACESQPGISFSEPVAWPDNLVSWFYEVEAVSAGLVSSKGKSNTVVIGYISPPYSADFNADALSGWTVIDANEDGKTWAAQSSGNCAKVSNNKNLDTDDWLITPGIKLSAGYVYLFECDFYGGMSSFMERSEIKWGTSPEVSGMSMTLVDPIEYKTSKASPVHVREYLMPASDEVYYVGIHGISYKGRLANYVANIRIGPPVSAYVPDSVSSLRVNPDVNGALTASVLFTSPDVTINGNPLEELSRIEILRNGESVKTFDAPPPGTPLSFADILPDKGEYTYTVECYNSKGKGEPASASAYVGLTTPSAPGDVRLSRTVAEGEARVEWDAVASDINGKVLPSGSVTYNVYLYSGGRSTELATGLEGPVYTWMAVEGGNQDWVQVQVCAVHGGLESQAAYSGMIPVGKPYPGIAESFAGKTMGYIWSYLPVIDGKAMLLATIGGVEPYDSDGGMMGIWGNQPGGAGAYLYSGLVSLEGMENPVLSFYTYNQPDAQTGSANVDLNEITVAVLADGETEYTDIFHGTVKDICHETAGWDILRMPLSGYTGQNVQFRILCINRSYQYTLIDNIRLGSGADHDLVMDLQGSETLGIAVRDNEIRISNAQGFKVSVARADGTAVYYGDGDGNLVIPVGAGVYVIRAGQRTAKVSVR